MVALKEVLVLHLPLDQKRIPVSKTTVAVKQPPNGVVIDYNTDRSLRQG